MGDIGSLAWLAISVGGATALGGALAFGLTRGRSVTSSQNDATDGETARFFEQEARDRGDA